MSRYIIAVLNNFFNIILPNLSLKFIIFLFTQFIFCVIFLLFRTQTSLYLDTCFVFYQKEFGFGQQAGERRKGGENSRDDDSSDDGSSYRDDEDDETSDEDEAITVGKLKDLEWDNSTLA